MSEDQITAVLDQMRSVILQRVAPYPRLYGELCLSVQVTDGRLDSGKVTVTATETCKFSQPKAPEHRRRRPR